MNLLKTTPDLKAQRGGIFGSISDKIVPLLYYICTALLIHGGDQPGDVEGRAARIGSEFHMKRKNGCASVYILYYTYAVSY